MLSLARVVVSSAVAYLAYGLGGAAMLVIPGTPHYRLLQQMHVLDSYRNNPDLDAANPAFDEFLRIGRQADWAEATILSAFAAGVVLLLWRRKRQLSSVEILSIVPIFVAGVMWRSGSTRVGAALVTAAFVFGVVLATPRIRELVGSYRARAA
jgi:hypothetical protein